MITLAPRKDTRKIPLMIDPSHSSPFNTDALNHHIDEINKVDPI